MRKLGRILLRIAVALTILIAASLMTIVLVVRSGWFQERVRERIIFEVEHATGSPSRSRQLYLRLDPPGGYRIGTGAAWQGTGGRAAAADRPDRSRSDCGSSP